jgi:DNA-directed RNA polymerase specialized sigma24 family protein
MFVRNIFKMLISEGRPPICSFSDPQLLNLIRQNNQQAFEVIFERYWNQLFDLVFARLHSMDSSRIIVQDIFITLWLKRKILSTGNLWDYLVAEAITRSLTYCKELQKNLEA